MRMHNRNMFVKLWNTCDPIDTRLSSIGDLSLSITPSSVESQQLAIPRFRLISQHWTVLVEQLREFWHPLLLKYPNRSLLLLSVSLMRAWTAKDDNLQGEYQTPLGPLIQMVLCQLKTSRVAYSVLVRIVLLTIRFLKLAKRPLRRFFLPVLYASQSAVESMVSDHLDASHTRSSFFSYFYYCPIM